MARLTALRKPDGGCVESPRTICSAVWFRKRLPGSGPISSIRQRGHSNLRCKRELEQMSSQPTCVPPSRHAAAPCWCRWTAAAPTTACRGRPSSANSARWHPSCSLSCACFTGAPPATAGGTPLAAAGMFLRAKGASKGTPSLPHFSRSDSTMLSNRRQRRYTPTTASSLSWTTSLSHSRPACEPPWTRPCTLSKPGVASHPIWARLG